MTGNEQDAEVGRIVRSYVEAGRNAACLRTKLERAATAISALLGAIDGQADEKLFATAASNALTKLGDIDVADTAKQLSETWGERAYLQNRLREMGFAEMVS